jgi:hypothetical protein
LIKSKTNKALMRVLSSCSSVGDAWGSWYKALLISDG